MSDYCPICDDGPDHRRDCPKVMEDTIQQLQAERDALAAQVEATEALAKYLVASRIEGSDSCFMFGGYSYSLPDLVSFVDAYEAAKAKRADVGTDPTK